MKSKDISNVKISTILGADTQVAGDFSAKGSTRADGTIEGNVTIEGGVLVLGATGCIHGNIVAESAVIGGEVIGDVTVSEKLEVLATAKLMGNIVTKMLVIDEHAVFQGNCNMNQEPANPRKLFGKGGKVSTKVGKKSAKSALEEALKEVKGESDAETTEENQENEQ